MENAAAAGASAVLIFNQGNVDPSDDRFGLFSGTLDPDPATEVPGFSLPIQLGADSWRWPPRRAACRCQSICRRRRRRWTPTTSWPTARPVGPTAPSRRGPPRQRPRRPRHQRQRQRLGHDPRGRRADVRAGHPAAQPGAIRLLGRRGGRPDRLVVLRLAAHRGSARTTPSTSTSTWSGPRTSAASSTTVTARRVRHEGAERLGEHRERLRQLLRLPGAGNGADGVRRPVGLLRVHRGRDPRRRAVHRRRRHQDAGRGCAVRRNGRGGLRPLLPLGVRHHRQHQRHGTGPDVGRRRPQRADVRHDVRRRERHLPRQRHGRRRGVPRRPSTALSSTWCGEGSPHQGAHRAGRTPRMTALLSPPPSASVGSIETSTRPARHNRAS